MTEREVSRHHRKLCRALFGRGKRVQPVFHAGSRLDLEYRIRTSQHLDRRARKKYRKAMTALFGSSLRDWPEIVDEEPIDPARRRGAAGPEH